MMTQILPLVPMSLLLKEDQWDGNLDLNLVMPESCNFVSYKAINDSL